MTYQFNVSDALLLLQFVMQGENGKERQIAAAVYDVDGKELAFASAHGVRTMCNNIACAKSRVSASSGKTTREVRSLVAKNDFDRQSLDSDIRFGVDYAGGVPIFVDNVLVGAIGVSNLTEDEDERIAHNAVASLIQDISVSRDE